MTALSLYGASAVKRERSTNRELASLDQAILEHVGEQNPITVRGVFYAMSVRGHVPKNDSGYRRVQQRVLRLRRSGLLPYDRIADSTRWMRRPEVHADLQSMLDDAQQFYRRDIWSDQDAYVEVWCEKDALAGVLMEATAPWHVPLMVSRGFASESYLHESAASLEQHDKPAYVYLFTDLDAAGLGIDEKIRQGLKRFAPRAEIHFQRAALTPAQVRDMGLPTREPKPRDVAEGFTECCELDAIPPRTLIDMTEGCIRSHIDRDRLARLRVVEAAERETLRSIASTFGGAS